MYVCAPDKNGGHRALADIQDSIVELEYYRRALLPENLNPESGFYHQLAGDVVEEAKKNFAEFELGKQALS